MTPILECFNWPAMLELVGHMVLVCFIFWAFISWMAKLGGQTTTEEKK